MMQKRCIFLRCPLATLASERPTGREGNWCGLFDGYIEDGD